MGHGIERIKILIPEKKIAKRVDELAEEVASDYQSLLLVGILRGAYVFVADLARALSKHGFNNLEVDFMGVESQNVKQESSKDPKITLDLKRPIRGVDVLLSEDIIDTGYSMETLLAILWARGPASLAVISLLSKEERREVVVPIKYKGFDVPNRYLVGYGLDDGNEKYRQLPDIGYIPD